MKSKELKAKTSHAHSLILPPCVSLCEFDRWDRNKSGNLIRWLDSDELGERAAHRLKKLAAPTLAMEGLVTLTAEELVQDTDEPQPGDSFINPIRRARGMRERADNASANTGDLSLSFLFVSLCLFSLSLSLTLFSVFVSLFSLFECLSDSLFPVYGFV